MPAAGASVSAAGVSGEPPGASLAGWTGEDSIPTATTPVRPLFLSPVGSGVVGRVEITDAVAAALGTPVRSARPVPGGDVARAFRVTLDDGTVVFAKTHDDPPPGFFTTEATGLSWLAEAQAVPVARVLAVGDVPDGVPLLVLEWIDVRLGADPDERAFGSALAHLHAAGAPCFGRTDRRPTGSRQLPNDPCATWAEFYATRRLLPLVRLAGDTGAVDPGVLDGVERIAANLGAYGDDVPPARLHGDLWAGNRVVDRSGTSWLIDPAAHGGHPEFDLAMMDLFGGFGPDALAAYHEVAAPLEGWERRRALHQLAPLLVHAIKFGGPYPRATAAAVGALT